MNADARPGGFTETGASGWAANTKVAQATDIVPDLTPSASTVVQPDPARCRCGALDVQAREFYAVLATCPCRGAA